MLPAGVEGVSYFLNRAGLRMPVRMPPETADDSLPHEFALASSQEGRMVHEAIAPRFDPASAGYPRSDEVFRGHPRVLTAGPNFHGTSEVFRPDGVPIYSVQVSTDALGRRVTVDPDPGRARAVHLTTLGCSFTWGQGVNDGETLASQLAGQLQDRRVYNLGISGAGPNDLLAREEQLGLFGELAEQRGDAVYLFIGDHVRRANGAMSVVGQWAAGSAYMEEVSPGRFQFAGPWREAFPFRTRFFHRLANRQATRFFRFDWPPVDRAAVERTARMLSDLRRVYRVRTDTRNGFTVVIFETSGVDRAMLRAALDQSRIPYLDYSSIDWSRVTGEAATYALDGHPRAPTYAALAQALVEDLRLPRREP